MGELEEPQYWIFNNGTFVPPWDAVPYDKTNTVHQPTDLAASCRQESESQLRLALAVESVQDLFNTAFALGATQKLIVVTTDTGSLAPIGKVDEKDYDRSAYFWHWNQDNRIPSVASSQFDRGVWVWVWESTVSKGECTHPSLNAMREYLQYSVKRLTGFKIIK